MLQAYESLHSVSILMNRLNENESAVFKFLGSLYFGRTQFSRLFGGCIRCHVSCGGARNSLCAFIYSRPSRILGSVLHSCNKINISSLQCYSVLSTIAQVLRKMSLKILAS